MSAVPWSTFSTYPDGRPKFDGAWLLNPANVVTRFSREPGQYCRLCDSYFTEPASGHVKGHEPSLRAWQKKKPGEVSAAPEKQNLPLNHAGKNGQEPQENAAHDAPYVFTRSDRRKARSSKALAKGRQTRRTRFEARRAQVLELDAAGLVPAAIADKLGISDRSVRRYFNSPTL